MSLRFGGGYGHGLGWHSAAVSSLGCQAKEFECLQAGNLTQKEK